MFIAITNFLINTYDIHYGVMLIGFIIEILFWIVCAFGYIINIEEE